MKRLVLGLLVLACAASPCRAAGLQLSIQDGRVTIDAQDVTIRQILTEWARIGKTRIVNIERLSGGPTTIKFEGLPEKQALDIVLRAIPGYVAAPRETLVANASVYDTILIMATTTPVAALRVPPAPAPGRGFGPGFGGPQGPAGNITQLRPAPMPVSPGVPFEFSDPAADQQDDSAMAAAAAAGLVAVPASMPGISSISPPLMMPGGGIPQSGPSPNAPTASTPTNPWNAPPGTSQPSLAPAPPPSGTQPLMRPRPPQADR